MRTEKQRYRNFKRVVEIQTDTYRKRQHQYRETQRATKIQRDRERQRDADRYRDGVSNAPV